MRKQLISLQR